MVSKKQIAEIESVVEQMALGELLALREGLNDRITTLQDAEKDKFIASFKAQAEQLNLNLSDLATALGIFPPARRPRSAGSGAAGGRASPKAKYRDPISGEEWSGRGRPAKWLAAYVAEGEAKGISAEKVREKYLIKE
jgi:DNA-binding protein H-NS